MKLKTSSLTIVVAAVLLAFCNLGTLQAQDAAPAAPAAAAPEATPVASSANSKPDVKTKTLFQQIQDGGWVMFPIGFCSVFTLYLIFDGMIRTAVRRVVPLAHEEAAKDYFRKGDYMGAYQFCKENSSPFNNVLRVGLSLLGEGKHVTEEGLMGELAKENSKLQTYISYLSVIGVCTPMIGLLGTVTGMIRAFATLGSSGIGDPSSLSSAIGEVLIATASGLFIAIPAFGAFYYLRNRAMVCTHYIQDLLNSLFRKMPYDNLAEVNIGDEEIYAAEPNWNSNG